MMFSLPSELHAEEEQVRPQQNDVYKWIALGCYSAGTLSQSDSERVEAQLTTMYENDKF